MALCGSEADTNGCSDTALAEDAVRRLLSSEQVRLSDRNRRFIEFVVSEALAGRGDRIKAYAIGVDVFGRGEDFDPNSDPIVRIEATRLRATLASYYGGPGRDDPVRIVMRPGSYAPTFVKVGTAPASAGSRRILVVEHLTPSDDKNASARGSVLVDAIVKKLVAAGITIYFGPGTRKRAVKKLPVSLNALPDLCQLSITVHGMAEGNRYTWLLSRYAVGEICCIDHVDRSDLTPPTANTIDDIADRVLASISALI